MSKEFWALAGVVIGALATGGMGLLRAHLQRQWSVDDAERAWEKEKRDRLFEAKRSTHEAFAEALHRGLGILDDGIRSGAERIEGLNDAVNQMVHQEALLGVYAAPESTTAANDAIVALLDRKHMWEHRGIDNPAIRTEFTRARIIYMEMLRHDLGIELNDLSAEFENLKKKAAPKNAAASAT